MILAAAVEIFQAELVLDCDDEPAVRTEQRCGRAQKLPWRVRGVRKDRRVLQHTDQDHPVEALLGRKLQHVVIEDRHVGKIAAAFRGRLGAQPRSLDRRHLGADLAEIARDRATAATELEHPVAGLDAERPHDAVALAAEVIFRRPVDDRLREFVGKRAAILRRAHDVVDVALGARTIAVADALKSRALEQVERGVTAVTRPGVGDIGNAGAQSLGIHRRTSSGRRTDGSGGPFSFAPTACLCGSR